jgi:hypothetical protein
MSKLYNNIVVNHKIILYRNKKKPKMNLILNISLLIIFTIVIIFILLCPLFFIKSVKKHLTLTKLSTGFITLLLIVFIKESNLSLIILNIFEGYINDIPKYFEYIIASSIGLIGRLGVKGLIEEGFKELFSMYNTMTIGGDSNLNANSGEIKDNSSGGSSTNDNNTDIKKSPLDKGKNPENDSAKSSIEKKNNTRSNFSSKRFVKLFDEQAERINSEIKVLYTEINNCKDEKEKALKEEDLEELFGQLSMLSRESAAETRKILNTDSQGSNKRTSDSSIAENSSKKRS